ncbi:MAG: aldehyde dehydrogenase family protein, partial [Pseudomonadota bacterium]|nr:aldehyde dehydrogenase family protein [Pseudomonadota bacterium]
ALMPKILARVRDWRMGDPLDPSNHLGSMIDDEHCAKVSGYLADAGKGVETLVGGTVESNYVTPTIFDGVAADSRLATEEIFGPVLSVLKTGSEDEAIGIANSTEYGLVGGIFTADIDAAHRAALEDCQAGRRAIAAAAERSASPSVVAEGLLNTLLACLVGKALARDGGRWVRCYLQAS